MTLAEGQARVYFLTGSDVNSYSNASFLINLNIWSSKILGMIMRKSGTWVQNDKNNTEGLSEINLIANQNYIDIPAGTTGIRRVELALDGTNFYESKLINEKEINVALYDDIKVNSIYTTSNPRHRLEGNKMYIYPKPLINVTKGCKILINQDAYKFSSADLSAGTKSPGFDTEFHDMLFTAVAYEWAKAKSKEVKKDLLGDLQAYYLELGLHYSDKAEEEEMKMQALNINYN